MLTYFMYELLIFTSVEIKIGLAAIHRFFFWKQESGLHCSINYVTCMGYDNYEY